jgi:hypothetical protein
MEVTMPSQVYYDLREQLDEYSLGFPSTVSGVEMKILEKLFTQEKALMPNELSGRQARPLSREEFASLVMNERYVVVTTR